MIKLSVKNEKLATIASERPDEEEMLNVRLAAPDARRRLAHVRNQCNHFGEKKRIFWLHDALFPEAPRLAAAPSGNPGFKGHKKGYAAQNLFLTPAVLRICGGAAPFQTPGIMP